MNKTDERIKYKTTLFEITLILDYYMIVFWGGLSTSWLQFILLHYQYQTSLIITTVYSLFRPIWKLTSFFLSLRVWLHSKAFQHRAWLLSNTFSLPTRHIWQLGQWPQASNFYSELCLSTCLSAVLIVMHSDTGRRRTVCLHANPVYISITSYSVSHPAILREVLQMNQNT